MKGLMSKMSATHRDGRESASVARQRAWLEAKETESELEQRAERANDALRKAKDDTEKKRQAFFDSMNS